jgi:hypothetical protein
MFIMLAKTDNHDGSQTYDTVSRSAVSPTQESRTLSFLSPRHALVLVYVMYPAIDIY